MRTSWTRPLFKRIGFQTCYLVHEQLSMFYNKTLHEDSSGQKCRNEASVIRLADEKEQDSCNTSEITLKEKHKSDF